MWISATPDTLALRSTQPQPELSEAHTISHPHTHNNMFDPFQLYLLFLVFTFLWLWVSQVFVSDFIAMILPLSFHHEEAR